jgi:hypothetical protein
MTPAEWSGLEIENLRSWVQFLPRDWYFVPVVSWMKKLMIHKAWWTPLADGKMEC